MVGEGLKGGGIDGGQSPVQSNERARDTSIVPKPVHDVGSVHSSLQ